MALGAQMKEMMMMMMMEVRRRQQPKLLQMTHRNLKRQ
jgi:hypothetical protein